MKCPNCNNKVKQVKTTSHYGIPIVIDQCIVCGGIWFDDSELYQTRLGAAHKIDKKINVARLKKPCHIKRELQCPHDGTKMKQVNSIIGLSAVKMNACPKCDGTWLNRGAFLDWQVERMKVSDKQEKKQKKMTQEEYNELDAKIQKQINAMMRLQAGFDRKNAFEKDKQRLGDFAYFLFLLLRMIFFKK